MGNKHDLMSHTQVLAEIERLNQCGSSNVAQNQATRDEYLPLFRRLATLEHNIRTNTLRHEHARMKQDYNRMETPASKLRLLSGFVVLATRMTFGDAFDRTIFSTKNGTYEELYWKSRQYQVTIYPTGRMHVQHEGVVPFDVDLLDSNDATYIDRWL